VVLASDSLLLGDGLEALLTQVPNIAILGRTRAHFELLALVDELAPARAVA
jgi:hypothetical protein